MLILVMLILVMLVGGNAGTFGEGDVFTCFVHSVYASTIFRIGDVAFIFVTTDGQEWYDDNGNG